MDISSVDVWPTGWWKTGRANNFLADFLVRHVLSLVMSYEENGMWNQFICSGCPLLYKGYLLWLTAGHCAKEIVATRDRLPAKCGRSSWMAPSMPRGIPGPPVDLQDFRLAWSESPGVDVGVGFVAGFPSGYAMLSGGTLIPL